MCNPMAAVALAMTAAGTYAQSRGARQAEKAMSAARNAEAARQGKLRSEADQLFNESLGKQGADVQKKRLATEVEERSAASAAAQVAQPIAEFKTQGDAPKIVKDESDVRVAAGNARALSDANLAANVQGFGDLQLGNALLNSRYLQDQGNLSRFMSDSSNTLGWELEAAARRGDKAKAIGAGLQTAGSLFGMGAAMGVNPFASTVAPSTLVTLPSSRLMDPNEYYRLLTAGR